MGPRPPRHHAAAAAPRHQPLQQGAGPGPGRPRPHPQAVPLLLPRHRGPGHPAARHRRGGFRPRAVPRAVQGRAVHHPPEPVPDQEQLAAAVSAVARHHPRPPQREALHHCFDQIRVRYITTSFICWLCCALYDFSGHIQSIDNWTISWPPLSETMVTIAQGLGGLSLRDEDISKSVAKITEAGVENRRLYAQLVDSLCDLVEAEESLHWLHYNTTLTMLCVMIRSDVPLPSRAVRIFTNNLVHDNILVRKASLHVIDCVLKQH